MNKTWEVFYGQFSTFIIAQNVAEAVQLFVERFNNPEVTVDVIKGVKLIDLDKEMERLTLICKTGQLEKNKEAMLCYKI